MAEHQGQQANNNGQWFENDIAGRLMSHGYIETKTPLAVPYFIRQERTRFWSMYGTRWKVDFYVWHPHKYPHGLVIEAKHQQKGGSVDEKFPYLVTNMRATGIPGILILMCPKARVAAIAWCLAQQDGERFRVFATWETFISACNRGLL